jgi:hypothetical protein
MAKTAGIVLSILGGLASIGLAFYFPIMYSSLMHYSSTFGMVFTVLQVMMIAGGILSVIGGCVGSKNSKAGFGLALAGGLVAGINILSLVGAGMFKSAERLGE